MYVPHPCKHFPFLHDCGRQRERTSFLRRYEEEESQSHYKAEVWELLPLLNLGFFPSSWVETWDACVTYEDNVRWVVYQDIGDVDPIKLILDVIHCFLRLCKGSPLEIIWVAGKHLVEIICYERCRGPTVSRISRNKYKRDYNQSTICDIDLKLFCCYLYKKEVLF